MFSSERALRSAHGLPLARKIRARLTQLEAADCLHDLRVLPGKWHALKGSRKGTIAANLTANRRLIIRPARNPPPTTAAGGLDWKNVTSIEVVDVIDYHGS